MSLHVKLDGWNDARKQVLKSKVRERVLTVFPRFEEGIVHELSGAPEAWKKFVARIEVGGFPQTKENTFFNAVSHRSGVDRLWLCGDTIFPGGGTMGVSVSGYHVFRSITNYQYSL
jgi:phytoene dehydrogenase-like protein